MLSVKSVSKRSEPAGLTAKSEASSPISPLRFSYFIDLNKSGSNLAVAVSAVLKIPATFLLRKEIEDFSAEFDELFCGSFGAVSQQFL